MKTLLAAVAILITAGAAHAAGVEQVKDWIGVCANTGACTAIGFGAEEDEFGAYLIIQRDAGPAAQPKATVVFDAADAQPSADWTFTVDGHAVAGLGPVRARGGAAGARAQLTGRAAASLIAALRNGGRLAFAPPGKPGGDISLSGSAATLLWVDDQQGRVGSVTAMVRPGPKPASSVPSPAPLPLIAPAPAMDQHGLPAHAPSSIVKGLDCDLDPGTDANDIVVRLAPGLVLWGPECTLGAYNAVNVFFLGDEHGGHLRRVVFPIPPGAGGRPLRELINAGFDAKSRILTTFAKARGVGDCGDATDWVWDGKAFRVISQTTMPMCRGMLPDDWPVLFASRQQ